MEPLKDDDPRSIGGYTLVCRLGSGGMGRVYLGESAAGQQVAVKVIRPPMLDEENRQRFVSEVDSLKTVYGPFVAPFVDADPDAEQPWLVVDYVPGPDLLAFVAGHGVLPLAETASLGALLAEGLHSVHQLGLLHRDLKPQNVVLAPLHGPKIIDFGLAVLAERRSVLTATGIVVGSVYCMPPEQSGGEHRLTPAADVYSLGAVLLYAATGHYPYSGENWYVLAGRSADPDIPPDLTGLPPELHTVISGMLAVDAAQRPTLQQVRSALVAVVTGCGITAGQARQRLIARIPQIEVPEVQPSTAAPCTPTEPDHDAGTEPDDAADTDDALEEGSAPDSAGASRPGPTASPSSGAETPVAPSAPASSAVRLETPLRIAERLRTAYAEAADF